MGTRVSYAAMAFLRPPDPSDSDIRLLARHVVGRRPGACDLVLDDPLCSSQHAELAWDGSRWTVRDLGSRNGTWLDGHPLPPSKRLPLEEGSRLAFGNPPVQWTLQEPRAPVAAAVDERGQVRFAEQGLLVLPDESDPRWTITRGPQGLWHLEGPRGTRTLRDLDQLSDDERQWRLVVPARGSGTRELEVLRPLDGASLVFRVSSNEEHVVIDALFGGIAHRLEPRAHNYLLLLLARKRLEDVARGLHDDDAGWVHRDELVRMLKVSEKDVNVQIYRARKHVRYEGVDGAARIVERRTGDGLLRIGVADLTVEQA